MGATEEFARFVHNTELEDMPKEAVSKAKEMFIDTIGTALAGTSQISGKIATKYTREMGGTPEATVLGEGFRTWAPMAAFTNALLAHNQDFDDYLPAGSEEDNFPKNAGHASCALVPTVLALGEKLGLSGKAVLAAYILGIEVYNRIAHNCHDIRLRGWSGTHTYGVIGAAAAAAKLLKLDVHQTIMAFGIAASASSGIFVNVHNMTNTFHAGNAARGGIEAALLAKEGFLSHDAIIESPRGFGDSFLGKGGCNYEKMTQNLGNPYHIVHPGLGIKQYPCAFPVFYAADGVLELRKEYSFTFEDVEQVTLWVSQYQYERYVIPEPKYGYGGRFSLNFACAAGILDGELVMETFTDAKLKEPKFKVALGKIKILVDEARAGETLLYFAPMVIKLKDGRELRKRIEIPKGHPKNPLTRDELLGKFRRNAKIVLPQEQIAKAGKLIEHLEELKDIGELMSVLTTK
ncbi:MmgE/PrpD family protein [Chloroflexota bacterium]